MLSKSIKLSLLITLFSLTFLNNFHLTHAQEEGVPQPTLEVNHVARGFEKIQEKFTLLFKFSKQKKADYHQYLAEKRFAEFNYAVNNDKYDLIEETSSRYATYLGRLSEYVLKKNIKSNKESLLLMYDNHIKIITELQKKYKYDSAWWLLSQHGINVAKEFSSKIGSL